jgi:Papain family cysteine protease
MARSAKNSLEDRSSPKTTRPTASSRRARATGPSKLRRSGKKLDAFPDRIDVRDWFYQPTLIALPDKIVNCDHVPAILDQGQEGACTGFALAAVINFLRAKQKKRDSVSSRMLYEMARRYDEWPGDKYEGSSARGAMIGWVRHGVCLEKSWPGSLKGPQHLSQDVMTEARQAPGGAFYRVAHREIRDMHAALNEVGILYMTLMVHDGWGNPGVETVKVVYESSGRKRTITLPIIERVGRAEDGHAVAIVGYTEQGFIIQNSWGTGWGNKGFALLPYEDYMLHATDVWVAQVGVPVRVDLWQTGHADLTAGVQRAQSVIPLDQIRPFTVDIGNNGKLSDTGNYWTTEQDVQRLFSETIPQRTKEWKKKRVLFFLHGGLNDEAAVARRIIAFRDVMLENEIYPIHIMWESGVMESIHDMINDLFTVEDERAGNVADWLRRTREGLIEAKDRTFELTAALPGTALWNEMKENAELASKHLQGGMKLIAGSVRDAFRTATDAERKKWELHVCGHSAGSIFAAYAMNLFCDAGVPFKTLQLMAPAMTVQLFKDKVMSAVVNGACPKPLLYILSDTGERDDDVGPYGKSLLYLVSNAFEEARATPILGMQRFIAEVDGRRDPHYDEEAAKFLRGNVVIAGAGGNSDDAYPLSRSETHGGFDNDTATMNSVLWRILDEHTPQRKFTLRDMQY